MDEPQAPNMLDPGDAPPIEPDFDAVEPPRTRWPTAIGIVSLFYAVIGLLCNTSIIGSTLAFDTLMQMAGMSGIEMPGIVKVATIASGVVVLMIGMTLLVGAVQLLKRRRSGLVWIKRWIMLRIVFVLVGVMLQFVLMPANMQLRQSQIEAENRMMIEAGYPERVKTYVEDREWRRQILTVGGFTAVVCIYPVFLTFYLNRSRITEEVAQWM